MKPRNRKGFGASSFASPGSQISSTPQAWISTGQGPDIVHTQCGYRSSRIRREERKGIHRETPGDSCISPCSEKKFMPFLCGGIVFPDNGGGFWPCRIGNEIRPQCGRTKSTPEAWTISAPAVHGSCDYIEARDFSPEGRGFSQRTRDCRAARHRENEIRPQSCRTISTPGAWAISAPAVQTISAPMART